jgi:putative SOS response-associated peptidase YedK
MCGRFTLTADPEAIQQTFNLNTVPTGLVPRYNIAPSQPIGVITNENPQELELYRWGLIPSWAKDPSIGYKMINARSETAAEKPAFRSALRRRRCLIPATGFYEWPEKGQPPVYVHLKDHELFAFAGLWEVWHSPEGEEVRTCTIMTAEPNDLVSGYHNRMAVIMPRENYADWLAPGEADAQDLMPLLLTPYESARMNVYEVDKIVNSPANDSPDCITPLRAPDQPSLL